MIQPSKGYFMKISGQWLSGAIVAVMAILLSSTQPALADSYTIFDLGNDNGHGIYGIDTAGDVVIWGGTGCGVSATTCYVTYTNGLATSDSSTAPDLVYDDGTPCSSTPSCYNAAKKVCNNGWIGLGTLNNPNGAPNGVYVGTDSGLQFLHGGSADQAFLNSAGDFAWADGQSEEFYVAIANPASLFEAQSALSQDDFDPATTPEPASLLLVGSGLLLFVAAILRKAAGQPSSYIN
jgi:hypothetical protein